MRGLDDVRCATAATDIPAIEAVGVGVHVGAASLLDDVSMCVGHGELFGLIGPNGAGKSTLIKALAQLLPHCGTVRIGGEPAIDLSAMARARRVAYLAQGDQAAWPLTVTDFVALGRLPHRPAWAPWHRRTVASTAVADAIHAVGLQALRDRRLDGLSGGERARARLARALAVQAPVLLADEPIASLDPFHQLSVMELLRRQCNQGMTVVVVLHDLTLASRFCDRLLLLHHARTVACGHPRVVLTPGNLQRVYNVHAMLGEHQEQRYVLPWSVEQSAPPRDPDTSGCAVDADHPAPLPTT